MKNRRYQSKVRLLVFFVVSAAYSIETYISSGWATVVRDTSLFCFATQRKVVENEYTNNQLSNLQKILDAFMSTFITSDACSPRLNSNRNPSIDPSTLQYLINSRLNCETKYPDVLSNGNAKPRLSIWFSPYRQFPETLPEGDQRSKGDYEYFSNVANTKCIGIAINYGAFKGSPGDLVFTEASKKGIRQEIHLAQKLGYNLFALDLNKVWLSNKDANQCRENHALCTETSDNFLVIDLKVFDGLAKPNEFLWHTLRMGEGSLGSSLEANSISPVQLGQWYEWEYPTPGSALRWSDGRQVKVARIDAITPNVKDSIPANLKISLLSNPSLRNVSLKAICTQGAKPTITMVSKGSLDITKEFSMCMPKTLSVTHSLAKHSGPILQQAPVLAGRHQRISYFGIQYSLKGANP